MFFAVLREFLAFCFECVKITVVFFTHNRRNKMLKSMNFLSGKCRGAGFVRLLRHYTTSNDVSSVGRSMIEMLGVLAIIGVLSVGGIAGYSKAMTKWKINKAIEEYTMMITGLMEYTESLSKNYSKESKYLADFVSQAKLVPETWKIVNNLYIEDSFGCRLTPYIGQEAVVTVDYHIVNNNSHKNSDFAYQLCMALALDVAYPVFTHTETGGLFITNDAMPNNGSYTVYRTSCHESDGKKVKCMSEVNPSDISKICKSCINRGNCNVGLTWR